MKWISRNGVEIEISEVSDNHLLNNQKRKEQKRGGDL